MQRRLMGWGPRLNKMEKASEYGWNEISRLMFLPLWLPRPGGLCVPSPCELKKPLFLPWAVFARYPFIASMQANNIEAFSDMKSAQLFLLQVFTHLFCIFCVCVCCVYMCINEVSALFLPHGFWVTNTGPQACTQAPFSLIHLTSPGFFFYFLFFNFF